MTTKTAALLISACAAVLCLFSVIAPNDPFFYFISSNYITDAARLAVAAWLVVLTTKRRFIYHDSKKLALVLAAGLTIFGCVDLVSFSLQNAVYGVIDPADSLMMMGCGLVAGASSLELKKGYRRLSSVQPKLPRVELRPLIVRLQTRFSSL